MIGAVPARILPHARAQANPRTSHAALARAAWLRLPAPARLLVRFGAGVWLTTALLTFASQRWLVFPTYQVAPPEGFVRPGVARVEVPTADGERLKGFWKPPAPGAGVVVTFHGNASAPEWHADRFDAAPWSTNGWGFLAVAYRGYPGSTGSPSEAGLLADGEAAVAYVAKAAPGAPLLLHGHSLGTSVAVAMAARHPAKGLYLEAPFTSMRAMAALRAPYLPSWLLLDTLRSDLRIKAVAARTVVVHGDADPLVPPSMGRALAGLAAPPAAFVQMPGDHVSFLGDADGDQEAAFRAAPTVAPRTVP